MLARLRFLDPACAAAAAAAALIVFLISSSDPYWSDWGFQDGPPVALLMDGDIRGFVDRANVTYLPSLVLRSPLFLLAAAFGGSEDEAFHVAKGFGLLLLAGLTAWLMTYARARGASWKVLVAIVFVLAGSPIAGQALHFGHAEDLMGAFLCVVGVLAASRGRLTAAGIVLGLAFVMKQWAILAWLPAAAVAPRRPWQVLGVAIPVTALFFLPLLFRDAAGGVTSGLKTDAFDIWRSHQIFWPLGMDNPTPDAMRPRVAPEWFVPIPRMIIVGMSVPLSALWWRHRRAGRGRPEDVLLLVALLFLGRCLFEPWNIDYYHLPFLVSLATWEVLRGRGAPVLAVLATAATWFSFNTWTVFESYGDATYVMYMSWTLPLAFVLLRQLLFPGLRLPLLAGRAQSNAQGVQPAGR